MYVYVCVPVQSVCACSCVCVCVRVCVLVCVCVNLCCLNVVIQGAVLTKRCFDTYYPGGSEKLEIFLESIMSGRYLFFAIKVTIHPECYESLKHCF